MDSTGSHCSVAQYFFFPCEKKSVVNYFLDLFTSSHDITRVEWTVLVRSVFVCVSVSAQLRLTLSSEVSIEF